jgi:DNA-binding NarL/FixJ family response regulator
MPISVSIVEDNDKLRGDAGPRAQSGGRLSLPEPVCQCRGRAEGFAPGSVPNVVLMDINLPGMNGVQCVRQLKALLPGIQVMMLTVYEDTENIFNALTAGANGYMLKRTSSKELLEAIQEVTGAVRR